MNEAAARSAVRADKPAEAGTWEWCPLARSFKTEHKLCPWVSKCERTDRCKYPACDCPRKQRGSRPAGIKDTKQPGGRGD